ncbi:D-tyrosyl-tRNA(Tyr) deacylase [filamentous cyanobacterium LEGE 11480]|uniref:D-aminoacyl-tRNA deacylase n=1 Tax=Romeriopsis navalis LEGE 11480 TaxID=2777977 RepID=A0A928VTU0_9CYAN|nr:D-aminoacyl-tRNA deacylase [Romeriopsis navalis]MBE9031944.1 D-tyrosyl-tRNA(Tyr) deacylase [Romeriopsis navalis LEGE 11480]
MRVVLQRVTSSAVAVDGQCIARIGRGLNLLVGICDGDTLAEVDWMVQKCLGLRVFPKDVHGRFDCSVQEIGGEILVISQFTLYGDCRKGRRPSFDQAAAPSIAQELYEAFVEKLRSTGVTIATGQFGANMQVSIENDGPVTLILDRQSA